MGIPGRWSLARRLAVGLIGVAVASFVASVIYSQVGQLGAYYSPFTRAWELAIGGLVALGTRYLQRTPAAVAAVMTWTGLVGLAVSGSLVTLRTPYPG